jgi:16S rRNA (uracil1498-N3)-methyltransferase
MRTFLIPAGADPLKPFLIGRQESRYLLRVLRLSAGDRFPAMDASGRELELAIGEDTAEGLWLNPVPSGTESSPPAMPFLAAPADLPGSGDLRITLYQCISKGRRMDAAVRMAAEAGVARIVPVLSERSVARTAQDGEKAARWARIVREARQQSGSRVNTEISAVIGIENVPADWRERGPAIFFHERPLAETGLHGYLNDAPPEAAALVGPEGGLSENETRALSRAGWSPAWFGPRVLRTETAAIYAIAALQTVFRERRLWLLRQDSRQKG